MAKRDELDDVRAKHYKACAEVDSANKARRFEAENAARSASEALKLKAELSSVSEKLREVETERNDARNRVDQVNL